MFENVPVDVENVLKKRRKLIKRSFVYSGENIKRIRVYIAERI